MRIKTFRGRIDSIH